ncbi:hypothetical protein DMH26_43065 [Streptomyces sp. WAC 05379]|nr:hypothetical protein DMH26_43065 [Streptomyces sp. WAC 05379]
MVGRIGQARVLVAIGRVRGRHHEGPGEQALYVTDTHAVGGTDRPAGRLAPPLPGVIAARVPSGSIPGSGTGR